MTGPEHYSAAEELMADAERIAESGGDIGSLLVAAQVHATLAQAAATALAASAAGHMPREVYSAWRTAAATSARCDCGQPIPAGEKHVAYCSDECKRADDDHGPDEVGGDES